MSADDTSLDETHEVDGKLNNGQVYNTYYKRFSEGLKFDNNSLIGNTELFNPVVMGDNTGWLGKRINYMKQAKYELMVMVPQ